LDGITSPAQQSTAAKMTTKSAASWEKDFLPVPRFSPRKACERSDRGDRITLSGTFDLIVIFG
jgi:hypothetical protein